YYVTFEFEAGDPFVINNNIPLTACANLDQLSASKTGDRTTVVRGEAMTFTLTFTNNSPRTFVGTTIVDRLPEGMVYTPGTGVLDGVAVEPVVNGRTLTWEVPELAPGAVTTAQMSVRITGTASDGTITNRTFLQDPAGNRVTNVAEASVRIEPEAVFDCSDLIGKVFDDRNGNGYQDGPDVLPAGVTDQSYEGGKFGVPEE
ncbi:MAG: hypothetical protein AAFY03_00850, partial [Pseudomonadota bacterium]